MPAPLTLFFAIVAVLALIGVVAWLVRRFAGNRLGANPNRSRMPRLAVIDAAAVDGRRRLVLVRRDNIEHLLMIGGPTDIVVESNIVRAMQGREQVPTRIAPLPEQEGIRAEPLEHGEPQMPEPRPAWPSFTEETRRAAPERRTERGDPLAGFAPEPLGGRAESRSEPAARMPVRSEPLLARSSRPSETPKPAVRPAERSTASPPPAAAASADHNLAEMAQRLEAALRRPASDTVAPPVAPPEPPPSIRAMPRAEPAAAAPPPAAPPAAAPAKSGFENLEDEMASLLGRPKNPS